MSEVYHIIVHGMVQGVGFRFYTQAEARRLGIAGWVRNLPTGDVELLARIPDGRKNQFLESLKIGPPASIVRKIDIHRAEETLDCPTTGFSIHR